ncbi:l-gulonolactone oxidase [Trichonephila inaurata madagascariensis]|uniref:L-gulonolactone oxidase n=1 Tax=Trichonephila inaurata madagascariensis TaxID=2747483 RepID=A0A8X7BY34_9ARAC|nr:l-gulonolactone oxidase [Trichonephila inaurata madagascariensis]
MLPLFLINISEIDQTEPSHAFRPSSLNIIYSSKSSKIMKDGIPNVHFKNWAETFECVPELFFAPKSQEEIAQILDLAREENKKVRVVGSKHSPSDIACTNGFMISLQNFNKLVEVDKKLLRVKVQAGMKLTELNDILYSHNLGLSVLGSVSDITIGGAISVGTHGTGIEYGVLSSYITEMELMLSNNDVIKVSPEKDFDVFQATVCSLGSFGIILTVTIQCEQAFNLHMRQYGLPLKDVVENLDVHLTGSDHFRFMWFPYTDNVVVSHTSRTDLPARKETWLRKIWDLFWNYGIGYHALEFCYYVSTFFPHWVPHINRIFYYLLFSTSSTKTDRSYRVFNFECLFKQYVNEWAIPIEKTGVVLWQLREWIETTPDVYVHFPIEVRFTKADNIFISPAFGRDTCYINIIMYRPYGKSVPYKKYWEAYEHIMLQAGGRPHWAKAHSITAQTFRHMYPLFTKWCSIRQQLDPINMFMNSYMTRIFS